MDKICATAFSVRFVKNGDYIQLVANVTNRHGAGKALFQIIDPNSGVVVPDWKDNLDEQPIINFMATSTVGYPVEITDIRWGFHGNNLSFDALTAEWQPEKSGLPFEARLNGMNPELKIVGNIASADAMSNRQITYEVSYVSNGMSDKVQGSLDILIQASGESSYTMQIVVDNNGIILSEKVPQTNLSVQAYYGTNPVTIGQNGYTVKWYQGETEVGSDAKLTVTRAMVEGGSVFVAKLLKDGNVVSQDSQRVNDIADEYQIRYTPIGVDYVGPKSPASFSLTVFKNNKPLETVPTFAWDIYNAIGVITRHGTGDTVTVNPEDCKVSGGTKENPNTFYSGVDVSVTANIN